MTDRTDASDPDRAAITEAPIEDWEAIVAGLERFTDERGAVLETDEGVAYEAGSARFEIQRNGTVSAGMPLHDLDGMEAAALRFDHSNGTITVFAENDRKQGTDRDDGEKTERFEYTFRRP